MLSVASVSRNLSVCAVEITTNLLQGFIYLSYFVHSHLYIYEVERRGGGGGGGGNGTLQSDCTFTK